jgi:hypothetical protein
MAFLWPIAFVSNQIPRPFYLLTPCFISSGHELPHVSALELPNLRKCDLSSFFCALAGFWPVFQHTLSSIFVLLPAHPIAESVFQRCK